MITPSKLKLDKTIVEPEIITNWFKKITWTNILNISMWSMIHHGSMTVQQLFLGLKGIFL
jgi:hypothetical protein